MTLAALLILAVVIVILLIQREKDAKDLAAILTSVAVERGKLLDRIQFPEVRHVPTAGDPVVHEAPTDLDELAFVGQEVPEFVSVGSPSQPPYFDDQEKETD